MVPEIYRKITNHCLGRTFPGWLTGRNHCGCCPRWIRACFCRDRLPGLRWLSGLLCCDPLGILDALGSQLCHLLHLPRRYCPPNCNGGVELVQRRIIPLWHNIRCLPLLDKITHWQRIGRARIQHGVDVIKSILKGHAFGVSPDACTFVLSPP